jgi:hypothetical protein
MPFYVLCRDDHKRPLTGVTTLEHALAIDSQAKEHSVPTTLYVCLAGTVPCSREELENKRKNGELRIPQNRSVAGGER